MTKIVQKFNRMRFWLIALLLGSSVPDMARAAAPGAGCYPAGVTPSNPYTTLKALFAHFNGSDPTKGLGSVTCFVFEIVRMAMTFTFILAVIMVLYGSLLYITAFGEEAKAETAKKTVIFAVIGLVVIAAAYTIVAIVQNELTT